MILLDLSRITINNNNGPTHRYSADLISYVIYMCIDLILGNNNSIGDVALTFYIWWQLIIIIFLISGIFIYNENIRIHACNLSLNTKAEIENRAKKDIELYDSILNIELDDSNSQQMGFTQIEDL